MPSLSDRSLTAFDDPPPPPSSPLPVIPWTVPTADRLLKTTMTTELMTFSSVLTAEPWNQNVAPFSAVSPPDPVTGEQYYCITSGGGWRFDYTLNPAAVPGTPAKMAGAFSSNPTLEFFSSYSGWAYAIDSSDDHYFLCAGIVDGTSGLYWSLLNQPISELPPGMHGYKPLFDKIQPQGLWATGETIWFTKSDDSLWQVALSDVLNDGTTSLQQVSSTGVVQAVISNGATTPTYYVLAAVQNESSYNLVEFPAGDPGSAVTIQTGWTLGGIKTTPDGAVWHVIPDMNVTTPSAVVSLLSPPFPINGQTPAWVDPFANADPAFYPAGTTQTIMDAIPLSATNVVLRTTANYATEQDPDWNPYSGWEVTRVGIGVVDQPAVPFPSYTGDAAQVYSYISQQLIDPGSTGPGSYDVRAQYSSITSSEADSYYTSVKTMSRPASITDVNAWNEVLGELTIELYNLVWTLGFWEQTTNLVNLQSQAQSLAQTYVSNIISIPTTATLLQNNGNTNALTLVGAGLSGGSSVLSLVSTVLGSCNVPAGSIIFGMLSTGASLASTYCSTKASLETNYTININDPAYLISAKLGDIEGILGQLFSDTLTVISSSSQTCTTDSGRLAIIAGLARNQIWENTTPQYVPGANQSPQSFAGYYNTCVATFFQAFVPLITGINLNEINPSIGGPWPTYQGQAVYVSPTHQFTDTGGAVWKGALLQIASANDQSKPIGQDLDALLFTTWSIPYADVFLAWGIPATPPWISS